MNAGNMSTSAGRKHGATVAEIRGFSAPDRSLTLSCALDGEIRLNYSALRAYLFAELTPLDVDLIVVAGVVSYADRAIRRHRARSWSRSFVVTVPVHHPEQWKQTDVSSALRGVLGFLTGDDWDFDFVEREPDSALAQLKLNLLPQMDSSPVVLPFSGGLDSFAMLKLLSQETPTIIVTAKQNISRLLLDETTRQAQPRRVHRATIPIEFAGLRHPEPTYRTRAFVFQVLAAIAARLSSASAIVIGENGQGSLGPALVPVGNEWPFRSTHPAFTVRLVTFLRALYGSLFDIRHPHLWATKGDVLKRLKDENLLAGWNETRSCSRNLQRLQRTSEYVGCGVCGGCLLRRMAVMAAALPAEKHYWNDLAADSLDGSVAGGFKCCSTENDRDIAVHNVLAMHNLALLREDSSSLNQAVFELKDALGLSGEVVRANLNTLLQSHRREWMAFVGALPRTSWVVQLTEEASR